MKCYQNKPQGYYDNVRTEMLKYLPENTKKIIDVGCENGAFATLIKQKCDAEVWGIELMEKETKIAATVLVGSCESHLNNLPGNYFDVIIF